MGKIVGAFNDVTTHLRAKIATGQALEYIKEMYVGEEDFPIHDNLPYLWVHYDDPAITETWDAARRIRMGVQHILVKGTAARIDPSNEPDKDQPFGTTSEKGVLSILEDVLDQLAQITFDPANRVQRYDVSVPEVAWIGQHTYAFTARLDVTQRYVDTGRA